MLHLKTDNALLSYSDDILLIRVDEDVHLEIKEMDRMLREEVEFTNYRKHFAIIDARSNFTSSEEVRKFYAEHELSKYRYADAIIVDSLSVRLVVNFYISFNKPLVPTKTFNTMEDAYKWIEDMKEKLNSSVKNNTSL